jgi:phage terminase small subunit
MKQLQPTNNHNISEKARKLVDILVSSGCTITEASKLAGYKGNSARVSASKMLRKPEVQAYMMQEVQRAFGLHSAKAVAKLAKLSSQAKSEYVQLEASKDILDRAGFKAPDKHQHLVAGNFNINIDLT